MMKTSKNSLRYSANNNAKVRNQKLLIGWGVPAVLVVIGTVVGFTSSTYMSNVEFYGYNKCWLNNTNAVFYCTVFGPMCLIYLINMFVFAKMLIIINAMSKGSDQFNPQINNQSHSIFGMDNFRILRTTTKSFGLLFSVLGFPFLFAFFSGKLF